jgi:hypothetical protein
MTPRASEGVEMSPISLTDPDQDRERPLRQTPQ